MSTYDDVVKDVAEDLDLDEAGLRACFSQWLGTPREAVAGLFTPSQRAQCYAVYRLTKGTSAFRSAMATVERRTGYIRQLADAVLSMKDHRVAQPRGDDAGIALARELKDRYARSSAEAEDDVGELRTRSGRVLTDADIEALADEAEKGYDVSGLRDSKGTGS